MRGQTHMTNSQAAAHESWLVDTPFAPQNLGEAIPIISDNGQPPILFGTGE